MPGTDPLTLMAWNNDVSGLLTALGIGLLIGLVRERQEGEGPVVAGVRTHALIALLAAVAVGFGAWPLMVVLVLVGGLAIGAHFRSAAEEPGLTGEIAMLVTALLAALAAVAPAHAAASAVVAAGLLYARHSLHRLARDVITPREFNDALLLAAAALVVLPFLPGEAIDPWGVLVPATIWRLVVLVMAVGMLGHVAVRMFGGAGGLLVAGFFAGFASSTAAVAGFGQHVRDHPGRHFSAIAAALLANLASLLLFAAVLGASAPRLLGSLVLPLSGAALTLLAAGLLAARRQAEGGAKVEGRHARSFRLSHALLLAALITGVLLVSTLARQWLGDYGAIATAMFAATVELHAAAASVAQLSAAEAISQPHARWGVLGLLAASSVAKSVLAFAAGDRRYGAGVALGLLLALTAACVLMGLDVELAIPVPGAPATA